MKRLIAIAALLLASCVAVPYHEAVYAPSPYAYPVAVVGYAPNLWFHVERRR